MPPRVGVAAQQAAHPVDAGRVEAVGRLVEDQHRRVAMQRVGDAEALAHAEGVVADPALRLGLGEADQLEHLVDARLRQAHRQGAEREHLAAGAAGVLGGGVEQDADVAARVGDVGVAVAADGRGAAVGRGEPDHDRACVVDLPAPLGPRKPVTRPGWAMKETSSTAVNPP